MIHPTIFRSDPHGDHDMMNDTTTETQEATSTHEPGEHFDELFEDKCYPDSDITAALRHRDAGMTMQISVETVHDDAAEVRALDGICAPDIEICIHGGVDAERVAKWLRHLADHFGAFREEYERRRTELRSPSADAQRIAAMLAALNKPTEEYRYSNDYLLTLRQLSLFAEFELDETRF